ncbi:hypothetical protein [Bdellovibrio sp. HCB2-146]|uniref:hypothetical protein n=1 Tax=Bdellovibrio sp. HCB2-146 TaxID=3394362 RepID=UPI0039BC52AC
MSFKAWISALICVSTLSGCTEFLEGKKREAQVIELSDSRFACLRILPKNLKAFTVGEATESQIRGSYDCLRDSLTYFQQKTYGSLQDAYTMEEMRRFFGKYFLKENNVTPQFASELMKIKRALLGGSARYITKTEISMLIDILATVRDESVLVAPHIRTLLNQAEKNETQWEATSTGIEQLRKSLHRILEKTQFAKSDYSFEDWKKALTGFSEFIRGSEPFAPYEAYAEWIPLIESVKNVLIGQRAQISSLTQWKEGLDSFLDLYELVLKYSYVIGDVKFEKQSELRQMTLFVNQTMDLIARSHQMKTTGRIPLEDIDTLIDQVMKRSTWSLRASSLKETYRWVLIKILEPGRKHDSRGLVGLEKKHLAALRREISVWRLAQSFIDTTLTSAQPTVTQKTLLEFYKSYDSKQAIEKGLTSDPVEQIALKKSWQDFGEILMGNPLTNFSERGRLFVSPHPEEWNYTWKGMTKLNFMRTLSRFLLFGYGDDVQDRMMAASMKKQGLIDWYEDFYNLGLDLKAFDPRSTALSSGGRSFMEANFFTFSGNGDDKMSARETFEFISVLFSAGLLSSADAAHAAELEKCGTDKIDLFGKPFLVEACFKTVMRTQFNSLFNNLPKMAKYVENLTPEQWELFYSYLKAASVTPDQQEGLIETANIRTMVTILHYVESVLMTFDVDGNDQLSLEEIQAAAPRFMSFLKTIKPDTSESHLTDGFAYLLYYGKIPGVKEIVSFKWDKMWGMGEVQRLEIIRLFGTLKEQLK